MAWLPDGTFVSDGYVNTRVVKFDKNGKYLMTWGQKGNQPNETRPGYMNTVHAIQVGKDRRVYVSDRANSRIQVFEWVTDGITQKVLKYDLTGKLLYSWGTFGAFPGGFWGVHQFSVDSEGSLYTADVHVGRPQKFRPKRGADPATLVGAPWPATGHWLVSPCACLGRRGVAGDDMPRPSTGTR